MCFVSSFSSTLSLSESVSLSLSLLESSDTTCLLSATLFTPDPSNGLADTGFSVTGALLLEYVPAITRCSKAACEAANALFKFNIPCNLLSHSSILCLT